MKKNLIAIGPLPPPNYGQSLGFKSLCEDLNNELQLHIVNIQPNYTKPGDGWKLIRLFEYFSTFIHFINLLIMTNKNCNIYITVGQSSPSFARDFIFIILGFLFKRKIFAHLKGGNFNSFYEKSSFFSKFLIKYIYRKVYRIIVLGPSLLNNFNFCKLISSKVVVVENGLTHDTNYISYKQKNNRKLNIIYLSNLIISKGYWDIIDALKILDSNDVKYKCVFAGNFFKSPDDPYNLKLRVIEKEFEKKINNMENVLYLGPVSGREKNKLLQNSDIFLLPTYYVNEGQPISIIEAMAYGNAIISTPYRSIVDIVVHGKEGLLIKPKKPDLIASALINLYNDKKKLESMKLNAYLTFKERFTREKHLKNMRDALEIGY